MNQYELEEVTNEVHRLISKDGDLNDFVLMMRKVLSKNKKMLEKQLKLIPRDELYEDMMKLKIIVSHFSSWSDTIDITTNPNEFKFITKEIRSERRKNGTDSQ